MCEDCIALWNEPEENEFMRPLNERTQMNKKPADGFFARDVFKRVQPTENGRTIRNGVCMKKPISNGSKTHFLVVTGGVISGLGKGVVTASIGNLLKSRGYSVTAIKIDPYLNFDAGTLRPTEHGEVFVTFDGGETDQDIGTYERFFDANLSRIHNITSGQVFGSVIQNERSLRFEGKTVQVTPHVPHEIERRIREVEEKNKTDFVLIEVGGVIGDYENVLFIEALKQMYLKGHSIGFVHVVYLPIPKNLQEMKTKPAQHSIKALNELGIFPDFVIARSEKSIDEPRKQKLSVFSNIPAESIISAPDLESIYEEPLIFEQQSFTDKILQHFSMPRQIQNNFSEWTDFVAKIKEPKTPIQIGIVGKYFNSGDFSLEDSYVSVIEAIKHAAWKHARAPRITWIDSKEFEENPASVRKLEAFDGVIVPGGFGASGVEGKIKAIQYCREHSKPYLGLCYGMQLAVVEFARNVARMKDAHTTEINPKTPYPVIDVMHDQKEIIEKHMLGNTMRLGNFDAELKQGSLVHQLYGKNRIVERHRHRYEVNPAFEATLESHGLVFSGRNPERNLVEFLEIPTHPFFVATQAHPELTSRPLRPNPLFGGFISACMKKAPEHPKAAQLQVEL